MGRRCGVIRSGGFLSLRRVDPGGGGQGRRRRGLMDEAFGVLVVGGGQDSGAAGLDGCGGAVVDVGGGVQAQAEWRCAVLYQGKNSWQCVRAASMEAKR